MSFPSFGPSVHAQIPSLSSAKIDSFHHTIFAPKAPRMTIISCADCKNWSFGIQYTSYGGDFNCRSICFGFFALQNMGVGSFEKNQFSNARNCTSGPGLLCHEDKHHLSLMKLNSSLVVFTTVWATECCPFRLGSHCGLLSSTISNSRELNQIHTAVNQC